MAARSDDGGGGTQLSPPPPPSLYDLVVRRNGTETVPFVAVHEAYGTLLLQVDALRYDNASLQSQLQEAEEELRRRFEEEERSSSNHNKNAAGGGIGGNGKGSSSSSAASAALKNETRLRDRLERLQEEYNAKLKSESDDKAAALKLSAELSELKDLVTAQEKTIANLRKENDRAERSVEHLTNEADEARSNRVLAERQYDGLKSTIRSLQEENDELRTENRKLEERLVAGKGQTVEEMNLLNDMIAALKAEVDMLRAYKSQEEKRRGWFGGGGGSVAAAQAALALSGKDGDDNDRRNSNSRKFGNFGVVVPSSPKHVLAAAHGKEGTCVRYDDSGSGSSLLATSSADSTVRVWDAGTGTVRATLRGTTAGHSITSCDISAGFVVGGGSDKTCRVWNLRTERMVRVRASAREREIKATQHLRDGSF